MTKPEAVTREDGAALRHVVDLALRGIRAKDRTPHPTRRPRVEEPWVMSDDGVINAPARRVIGRSWLTNPRALPRSPERGAGTGDEG
ncbi:hypothetical protein ACRAKI_16305 [Saccharothrix isguenensis]